MSNEDNLHGLEDLDDTRVSADELRAMPMSVPPATRRKAKYNFNQLPKQARQQVRVFDRYGVEQKDVIEFDPETFEGVRALKDGTQQNIYLFNGYISAAGLNHPDEEELPEIVENVRKERGSMSPTTTVDASTRATALQGLSNFLKCPKCQSGLRMEDIIENDGEVKQGISCSNGLCGMKWQQSNAGVGKS